MALTAVEAYPNVTRSWTNTRVQLTLVPNNRETVLFQNVVDQLMQKFMKSRARDVMASDSAAEEQVVQTGVKSCPTDQE